MYEGECRPSSQVLQVCLHCPQIRVFNMTFSPITEALFLQVLRQCARIEYFTDGYFIYRRSIHAYRGTEPDPHDFSMVPPTGSVVKLFEATKPVSDEVARRLRDDLCTLWFVFCTLTEDMLTTAIRSCRYLHDLLISRSDIFIAPLLEFLGLDAADIALPVNAAWMEEVQPLVVSTPYQEEESAYLVIRMAFHNQAYSTAPEHTKHLTITNYVDSRASFF